MANSGDLRDVGEDGMASVDAIIRNTRIRDVSFCMCIMYRCGAVFDSLVLSPLVGSADLLPFVSDSLHFCRARRGSLFRSLFAFEHPRHHLGYNGAVKNLHKGR